MKHINLFGKEVEYFDIPKFIKGTEVLYLTDFIKKCGSIKTIKSYATFINQKYNTDMISLYFDYDDNSNNWSPYDIDYDHHPNHITTLNDFINFCLCYNIKLTYKS